jgi:hypothetical protein
MEVLYRVICFRKDSYWGCHDESSKKKAVAFLKKQQKDDNQSNDLNWSYKLYKVTTEEIEI